MFLSGWMDKKNVCISTDNEILLAIKNTVLSFATVWIDLEKGIIYAKWNKLGREQIPCDFTFWKVESLK